MGVRYHKLQKCFKLISVFVPKAVRTLSDKAYSLLSVAVKTASFLLFFFSKCTPSVPSTRAPRANPRAAINEGREEEKITYILVSSQRLIVTSWFAIALAAGMRVTRIWREQRVLVMTLAMNMAKTSQSCLEDFVKTKFRKIMLPQKQGNTHHTCFDFMIVDRVIIHSFRAGYN